MVSSAACLLMRAMSSLRIAALVLAFAAVVMSGAFEMSGTPCKRTVMIDALLIVSSKDGAFQPMACLMPHRHACSAKGCQPSLMHVPNLQL